MRITPIGEITEYEAPRIVDHGSLTELTAGGPNGEFADTTIFAHHSVVGKLEEHYISTP
jgi:hypothetical protein